MAHLKVRAGAGSDADPLHAVVPVRSLGQRQVSPAHVFALPQRHLAHQEQPRAVRRVALSVFQAGSVEGEGALGGSGDFVHAREGWLREFKAAVVCCKATLLTNLKASLK